MLQGLSTEKLAYKQSSGGGSCRNRGRGEVRVPGSSDLSSSSHRVRTPATADFTGKGLCWLCSRGHSPWLLGPVREQCVLAGGQEDTGLRYRKRGTSVRPALRLRQGGGDFQVRHASKRSCLHAHVRTVLSRASPCYHVFAVLHRGRGGFTRTGGLWKLEMGSDLSMQKPALLVPPF